MFADHFVYAPSIGFIRTVRWSDIADISITGWGRYRALRIETSDGGRFRIFAADLGFRLSDLQELLKTRPATACPTSMVVPSGAMDNRYLYPGH